MTMTFLMRTNSSLLLWVSATKAFYLLSARVFTSTNYLDESDNLLEFLTTLSCALTLSLYKLATIAALVAMLYLAVLIANLTLFSAAARSWRWTLWASTKSSSSCLNSACNLVMMLMMTLTIFWSETTLVDNNYAKTLIMDWYFGCSNLMS